MDDNKIIRIGHYQNNTQNSSDDKLDIIRILGESEIPGIWKTNDKFLNKFGETKYKTISEYELKNNYTFLETEITETKKYLPKKLFDGLEDFNESENENNNFVEKIEEIKKPTIIQETIFSNNETIIKKIELTEDEKFIFGVLEKISISKENIVFATNLPKDNIGIYLEIPIDYNFNKLKETVNLLNLDVYKVINIILANNDIKDIIQQKMKEKIFELLSNNNIVEEVKKPIIVVEEVKKPIIVEEIKEKLISDENDPRINNILNKIANEYK